MKCRLQTGRKDTCSHPGKGWVDWNARKGSIFLVACLNLVSYLMFVVLIYQFYQYNVRLFAYIHVLVTLTWEEWEVWELSCWSIWSLCRVPTLVKLVEAQGIEKLKNTSFDWLNQTIHWIDSIKLVWYTKPKLTNTTMRIKPILVCASYELIWIRHWHPFDPLVHHACGSGDCFSHSLLCPSSL